MRPVPLIASIEMALAAFALVALLSALAPRHVRARRARAVLWVVALALWVLTTLIEVRARAYAPAGGGAFRLLIAAQRTVALTLVAAGLGLLAARTLVALASRLRAMRSSQNARAVEAADTVGATTSHATPPDPTHHALTRREALHRAAAVGSALTAGVSIGYGARWRGREVRVREYEVHIEGLPAALEGLELVQLTDIHVGIFAGPRDYEPVVEQVRRLRPDLVALTGDLLDHRRALVPEAMRMFARTRGRFGTMAIAGNHDHYTGVDDVLAGLRAAGITALDNDALFMPGGGASRDSGLVIAGLDDLAAPRYDHRRKGPDLDAALRRVSREAPRIVLAHNPKTYLTTASRCALQLSGHTHGGQINPFGVVNLAMRYVSGFYAEQGSLLFVSNGLGFTGPPVRLAAPAEVVRIGLTGRAGRGVRPHALPARGI